MKGVRPEAVIPDGDAMDKKFFLMGNAHLDPVWQWRMDEGLALVKSTFKSALDRMVEFPDYVFTSACAGYYEWIKYSEPEMFEKIKERVSEGRWQYVGAMWVQPDCNIPSGEAFVRHLMYSQRFFKDNFGDVARTGYNVDSFGHNGMLPQLFKKAGIENYVYMRPNDDNEKPDLPRTNLHFWESPDSSRIAAFRIADGYGGELEDERIEYYKGRNCSQIIPFGVGNHGGGPTVKALNEAERLIEKDPEHYRYSGPDDYFDYVRSCETELMPVVSEDLQHHASGCYSANSKIKKLNREAENELVFAEKTDVLAHALTGSELKTGKLAGAWKRVMFNQFHDILAGCSIKPAYEDAYAGMGFAKQTANEVLTFAAEKISFRVNTEKYFDRGPSMMRDRLWIKEGEGAPMVVFNPHSFPVETCASFGCQWVSGVVDENNNDVEYQIVRAPYTDGRHVNKCMFRVKLPAYGYATYYIFKDEQNYKCDERKNTFTVSETHLENGRVSIDLDKNGDVISYFDKVNAREYCSGPMRAVVCEDIANDTWGHNVFDYNVYSGSFSDAKLTVLENGTLRSVIKAESTYNGSTLVRYYTLYRDSSSLQVKCRTLFNEKYKLLKLTFPVSVKNPEAVYSMPFGFIKKRADGLEEPAQKWISVDGDDGALSLINDGRYSFCVAGNEMRMVAARTCAYLDHYGQDHRDGEMSFLDTDELEFRYALLPHDKNEYTETVKAAELLNTPVKLYLETHHKGELPESMEGIIVSCENVLVTTVKGSENGDGIVVRAFECAGKAADAEIDLKALGKAFRASFGPQEIKTFLIPAEGEVKEIPLTEIY